MNRQIPYLVIFLLLESFLLPACTPAAAGLVPPPTESGEFTETPLVLDTPPPETLETQMPVEVEEQQEGEESSIIDTPVTTPTLTATLTVMPTPQSPLAGATDVPPQEQESQEASETEPVPGIDCYRAGLVDEAMFPSDGKVELGESLEKVWMLRNLGSCAWTTGFALEFLNGEMMDAVSEAPPPVDIQPGETVDLRIRLTAPDTPGTHEGNWMVRLVDGTLIGVGDDGQAPLRIEFETEAATRVILDFVLDMCLATWSSQLVYGLDCPTPGVPGPNGWVVTDLQPVLEDGRIENEPALIVAPSEGGGGYISGFYPAVRIEEGDMFAAVIGCVQGSGGCNVVFQLNYFTLADPTTRTLGAWLETHNQVITHVDIDLTALAGQDVSFQLLVLSNGDSIDDRAFWLSPRITR